MRSLQIQQIVATLGAAAAFAAAPVAARAQAYQVDRAISQLAAKRQRRQLSGASRIAYSFKNRDDSVAWAHARTLADKAGGFRVVVSLQDRHVWAIVGRDTVLSAPASVAKGTTLKFGKQSWTFTTPRGMRTVLGQGSRSDLAAARMALRRDGRGERAQARQNARGRSSREVVRRSTSHGARRRRRRLVQDGEFAELPTDEHIVFDNTLFVPPLGTKNRKVEGELGKYRLILGDGYLLHGTPYRDSIGMAATHGCVRLRDEDIEWLYEHIPVGTKVYIY